MMFDKFFTVLSLIMFCLVANKHNVSFGTGFNLLLSAFSAGVCLQRLFK